MPDQEETETAQFPPKNAESDSDVVIDPVVTRSEGSDTVSAPTPLMNINLPENPELDRDPVEFGKKVDTATQGGGFVGGKSASPPNGDGGSDSKLQEKPYNPDVAHDGTREIVTLWLIGLFCTIVALAFVALFASGWSHGFNEQFFKDLKTLLDVLIGPVITLLSSAVGYYFGYQQGSTSKGK
jgi:hypothetical protein